MKNAAAAEQTFGNLKIVSWIEDTIRYTHILHLMPKYQEKAPLESGPSGKALVEALRRNNDAIYHDLTKDEVRVLKTRGAQIDIPDDEFNTVPSLRSVSTVTSVETSRSHWKITEDGKSCTPFDPAQYDPAKPERVTAAVQHRNEQTGALVLRSYFPEGKSQNPAPGVAAYAEIENGFEYKRHHISNGFHDNYVPADILKAAEEQDKIEGEMKTYYNFAKLSIAQLNRIEPAKAIFDKITREPLEKVYMQGHMGFHDLVAARTIRKDGTPERLPVTIVGRSIPAIQKLKDHKLVAATSFNRSYYESKLDQAEIDAFNKAHAKPETVSTAKLTSPYL